MLFMVPPFSQRYMATWCKVSDISGTAWKVASHVALYWNRVAFDVVHLQGAIDHSFFPPLKLLISWSLLSNFVHAGNLRVDLQTGIARKFKGGWSSSIWSPTRLEFNRVTWGQTKFPPRQLIGVSNEPKWQCSLLQLNLHLWNCISC